MKNTIDISNLLLSRLWFSINRLARVTSRTPLFKLGLFSSSVLVVLYRRPEVRSIQRWRSTRPWRGSHSTPWRSSPPGWSLPHQCWKKATFSVPSLLFKDKSRIPLTLIPFEILWLTILFVRLLFLFFFRQRLIEKANTGLDLCLILVDQYL